MKEIITMVKGYIDDLAHLMMSFVAIGAVSEVIFGSGIFGVNVIGNLTSIINSFGESGFAGLVALLVLVGLFRKQVRNSLIVLHYRAHKKGNYMFPFFIEREMRFELTTTSLATRDSTVELLSRGADRDRTCDFHSASVALSQLSYSP